MRTISGSWVDEPDMSSEWTAPSGRVYRVQHDRGTIVAFCNGQMLQTAGDKRAAWWRYRPNAMFACEVREALRVSEESRAKNVQTSAPSAKELIAAFLSLGDGPEEQFAFRVGQALRSKQVGALDSARRWLTDAISALDEIQRREWAKRDAAARSK